MSSLRPSHRHPAATVRARYWTRWALAWSSRARLLFMLPKVLFEGLLSRSTHLSPSILVYFVNIATIAARPYVSDMLSSKGNWIQQHHQPSSCAETVARATKYLLHTCQVTGNIDLKGTYSILTNLGTAKFSFLLIMNSLQPSKCCWHAWTACLIEFLWGIMAGLRANAD